VPDRRYYGAHDEHSDSEEPKHEEQDELHFKQILINKIRIIYISSKSA
jgi:hypothetical protein